MHMIHCTPLLRDGDTRPWTRLLSTQIHEPSSIPFWTALLVNALGVPKEVSCADPVDSVQCHNPVHALVSITSRPCCQLLAAGVSIPNAVRRGDCAQSSCAHALFTLLCTARVHVRHAFRRMFAYNMCSCFDLLATFKFVVRVTERAVFLGLQERT